jgi:DNA-binding NarL/FixJ family response regulator
LLHAAAQIAVSCSVAVQGRAHEINGTRQEISRNIVHHRRRMRDGTSELRTRELGRVMVVGEDLTVASELGRVVRELGCIVAHVDSLDALWTEARSERPDVVVLDVDFAGPLAGIEVAHQLHAKLGVRVIYLSAHAQTEVVQRAKLTHPYGYLLKPVRAFDLASCLELALHRASAASALPPMTKPAQGLSTLTGRERDVLRLIAQGHTSKDIATKLTIAKATVDTYRSRLSEKLGAKSRADLVRVARSTGLLD